MLFLIWKFTCPEPSCFCFPSCSIFSLQVVTKMFPLSRKCLLLGQAHSLASLPQYDSWTRPCPCFLLVTRTVPVSVKFFLCCWIWSPQTSPLPWPLGTQACVCLLEEVFSLGKTAVPECFLGAALWIVCRSPANGCQQGNPQWFAESFKCSPAPLCWDRPHISRAFLVLTLQTHLSGARRQPGGDHSAVPGVGRPPSRDLL